MKTRQGGHGPELTPLRVEPIHVPPAPAAEEEFNPLNFQEADRADSDAVARDYRVESTPTRKVR